MVEYALNVEEKKSFKNIEFFRFLLAEILVFFHLKGILFYPFQHIPMYDYLNRKVVNGEQVVDFFFIISGFFLIYTYKNISIVAYIVKKLSRFFPTLIVVAFLYWVASLFGYGRFNGWQTFVSDILLFNSSGFVTSKGSMGSVWFICVLFWVSLFYFYLISNFERKHINIVIALIVWCSYTLLIQSSRGSLNGNSITVIASVFPKGFVRGLAGIGVGYLIGVCFLNPQRICLNFKPKVQYAIYTVLEIVLFLTVFSHITFYKNPIKDDVLYIVLFSILLFLFLGRKGWLSNFFESKFSGILGRYSFCLFISHGLFLKFFNAFFPKSFIESFPALIPILFLGISSCFAVILYHCVEKPGARLFKKTVVVSEKIVRRGGVKS